MDEDLNQKSVDELEQLERNLAEENTNLKNETQDKKQNLLQRIAALQKENDDLKRLKEMAEKDVSSIFDLTLAKTLDSATAVEK
jgi:hypothetical protein